MELEKSTLLRILSGEQMPNTGSLATPNKITIGYLKQDLDFEDGRTVQEEAEQAFQKIKFFRAKNSRCEFANVGAYRL